MLLTAALNIIPLHKNRNPDFSGRVFVLFPPLSRKRNGTIKMLLLVRAILPAGLRLAETLLILSRINACHITWLARNVLFR
jgi:hypothetical protein